MGFYMVITAAALSDRRSMHKAPLGHLEYVLSLL
jgi:hypothetical protein